MLTTGVNRSLFFSTLSRLLQEYFHFDRLCINLYDHQGEMLIYFTAAEGTMVSTLSPVRPAEVSSTVAGHVIATRKPVIITDFTQYFSESSVHPIAEAGLTATVAFPLMLDNEIIATLHCSFAEKPDNLYDITSFLLEISPVVATCVGAIFALEHLRQRDPNLQIQPYAILPPDGSIICYSKAMREVMRKVDAVAKLDIPVLLLGETGTGKSLLAQDIHRRSQRKNAHFIKVNCPSLSQTLFESELFGHAKGAFTGAAQKRTGRFELAHGGSLFLDEIGELTPEMQGKLLQVLEDSSFERVGESMPLAIDVRVIAATNITISEALASGKLREDLFYRLALCTIELPALRERQEDIAPLATALAAQASAKLGLPSIKLPPALMIPLHEYSWPGNVRELRNVIIRIVLQAASKKQITLNMVEEILKTGQHLVSTKSMERRILKLATSSPVRNDRKSNNTLPLLGAFKVKSGQNLPLPAVDKRTLLEVEREHIMKMLEHTRGVIAGPNGAAALLGMPRSTLQHKIRKLGLE
ncbi:MAG: sigma 54-interacting transcriptional regulator [Betaproteobacteria bacterium]|nr:sigma 54-interacting transcriptional regulator [Betaproteobacteria bacterium]